MKTQIFFILLKNIEWFLLICIKLTLHSNIYLFVFLKKILQSFWNAMWRLETWIAVLNGHFKFENSKYPLALIQTNTNLEKALCVSTVFLISEVCGTNPLFYVFLFCFSIVNLYKSYNHLTIFLAFYTILFFLAHTFSWQENEKIKES